MKKKEIFKILIATLIILCIITLAYKLIFLKSFSKRTQPLTLAEKEIVLEIINKNVNITGYELKYGQVHQIKNEEFTKIELISNNSKKEYLIDLTNKKILKR